MTDPEQLIADWLDGSLTEEQQAALDGWLKGDAENLRCFADAVMFEQQIRAATISAEEESVSAIFNPSGDVFRPRDRFRMFTTIAVALVAMSTVVFWPRSSSDVTFATLEQTRAALWESGNLPTADGSRLGQGTLRLAEGLATVTFDSGAEVVLEAPATLILADAMNCRLTRGTAVSDIPDSALGFRIKTPSADVVDYGTRFAVSVYEGTGETHTQVLEGLVQVEYLQSDKVVELKTGQRNTVIGEVVGEATDWVEREQRTIPVALTDHGVNWVLLEPVKDAYTGRVAGHESDELLYLKQGLEENSPHRTAYIGFDLSEIDRSHIAEAELLLHFAPTGWGLASHVPDATFSVYGMVGTVPVWDESILHESFPGEPDVVHLGSFTIPQGVQKGCFRVQSAELNAFLHQQSDSGITLKVVRDTKETEHSGLVHGFASRRHPVLPPPTLAIRTVAE